MDYHSSINPLDLKIANLQAFVRVAETGSFSNAANQLYLTQPTISRRISALEAILEVKLFDRMGNNVLLTEAGQLLYPKAKQILLETADLQTLIHNLSGNISGKLRIGVSGYIAEGYLRPILQSFTLSHSNVELDIQLVSNSVTAYPLLESGKLDFAVATLPIKTMPNLVTLPIWEDPMSFVVNRSHLLAKQHTTALLELAKTPAILPDQGTLTRQVIDHYFAAQNLQLKLALQIPKPANFQVIKMMVSLGLGWSVLPDYILDKTFQQLKVPTVSLTRYLGVIHHQQRTLSNAARAFINIFAKHSSLHKVNKKTLKNDNFTH